MGGRDSEMLQIACKGKFFWGEGQGGVPYHWGGGTITEPDMVLGIFGAWRGQWTWG